MLGQTILSFQLNTELTKTTIMVLVTLEDIFVRLKTEYIPKKQTNKLFTIQI